jgi:anti-sigma-K factor RskA
MSEKEHVIEELAAYALGALDREEAAAVTRHLAGCASCRAELQTYQAVVDHLPFSVPEAAPSGEVKDRLIARIRAERSAPRASVSWWDRIRHWLQRPTPAWQLGLVSTVLVIVFGLFLFARPAHPANFGQIALAATENAPGATGILIISADGEYGSLVVQGLPELDPDHQYQLWLIDNDQRTSGGVFSVHHGYAVIQVYAPHALSSYQDFGITIEPTGGSLGPTGAKVLGST